MLSSLYTKKYGFCNITEIKTEKNATRLKWQSLLMTPSSDKSLTNSGHLAYQSYELLRRLRVQDTELSKESVSTWILMV